MGGRTSRRYGFPFTGFVASREKTAIGLGNLSRDSLDWLLSPNEGQAIGRLGCRAVGETSILAPVGALEAKAGITSIADTPTNSGTAYEGMWCRQMFAFNSPSMDDREQTFGAIFADQHDHRFMGTMYARSTDSTDFHYVLGKEYETGSGKYYPTAASQESSWKYKMTPLPYYTGIDREPGAVASDGAVGLTRGNTAFLRQFWSGGGRKVYESDEWLHGTSYYGTPLQWNKRWNDATAGLQINRVRPWGIPQPLWTPTISLPTTTSVEGEKNWSSGDSFYVSVLFEMEDGSYSAPVLPRAASAISGGFGLVQINAGAGTQVFYPYIQWNNLPIGPPGTKAILLLRSESINVDWPSGTNATIQDVPIGKLRVTARIPGNQTRIYQDPNGNNQNLVENDAIVRYDHIPAPSGKYAFEFDQRVAIGNIAHSGIPKWAVALAPVNHTNAASPVVYDVNGNDESAACYDGDVGGFWAYRLSKVASSGDYMFQLVQSTSHGGAPSVHAGSPSFTGTSIQDVVDDINTTARGSGESLWRAALAPGLDGNIPATNLAPTSVTIAGCHTGGAATNVLQTTTTDGFDDVAVGMFLASSTVTAGTQVIERISATKLKMSASFNIAEASAESATAYVDTGDEGMFSGGLRGYVRCFGAAQQTVIGFRGAYLETLPNQPRDVYFTVGNPGAASVAAGAFVVGNRRRVRASAGHFLGGAPLSIGAVLCYSKAIYVLQNRKGGNTGEDQDYRTYVINAKRGCVAPESITHGDGWAGYMTTEGYVILDGNTLKEHVLSLDIHDPASGKGEWFASVQSAAAAVTRDTDGARIPALVEENKLQIGYALAGGHPQRRLVYDFSGGAQGSGLESMTRPDGGSYGWSAPLTNSRWGVMCAVRKSVSGTDPTAVRYFACADEFNSANSTGDARFYEFDVPVVTSPQVEANDEYSFTGVLTWTALTTLVTADANAMRAAVGSLVTGAGIPAATTVSARNTSNNTLTLSAAPTAPGTGGVACTFNRQLVQPYLGFAADLCESAMAIKAAQRVALLYRHYAGPPVGVMTLGINVLLSGSSVVSTILPNTGTARLARQVVDLSLASRSPGDVIEFSLTHTGGYMPATRPEVWGIAEAVVDVMEAAPAF